MMEDNPLNNCELQEFKREALTAERYEILELLRECKTVEEAVQLLKQRIAAGKA